jgi:hypothetical protein
MASIRLVFPAPLFPAKQLILEEKSSDISARFLNPKRSICFKKRFIFYRCKINKKYTIIIDKLTY